MRMLLLLVGIALGVGATLLTLELDRGGGPTATHEAAADDEEIEIPSRVRRIDGANVVVLTAEERALAGIVTETPRRVVMAAEDRTVGRVVDPAGLLDGWRQLRAADAGARAHGAIVETLRKRRATLQRWAARGEIAVAKELADLDVQYRRELDIGAARAADAERLHGTLVAQWGSALVTRTSPPPAWHAALAAGTAQLIEFTAATAPETLFVAPDERREQASPVQVLGAATAVLGAVQSATYYGITQRPDLRIGMRLTCWLPRAAAPREGLLVPQAALVWHGGERWYFVETAPGRFARHAPGATAEPHPEGLLVSDGLTPDSVLVVQGAQALLAEEFRAQIPEEDDD